MDVETAYPLIFGALIGGWMTFDWARDHYLDQQDVFGTIGVLVVGVLGLPLGMLAGVLFTQLFALGMAAVFIGLFTIAPLFVLRSAPPGLQGQTARRGAYAVWAFVALTLGVVNPPASKVELSRFGGRVCTRVC